MVLDVLVHSADIYRLRGGEMYGNMRWMQSVTLDADGGGFLCVKRTSPTEWGVDCTLAIPQGQVRGHLSDIAGLGNYLSDLAQQWCGWRGVKRYTNNGEELGIRAEHDGLGTVTLSVTLTHPWEPHWSFTADLTFGGGAHLERLAQAVLDFPH